MSTLLIRSRPAGGTLVAGFTRHDYLAENVLGCARRLRVVAAEAVGENIVQPKLAPRHEATVPALVLEHEVHGPRLSPAAVVT